MSKIILNIALTPFGKFSTAPQNFLRYEFHIRASAREKYQFSDALFSTSGNVIFPDFRAVRIFTRKINETRSVSQSLRAGHVNAMGLIDEIFHFVVRLYEETVSPGVFVRAGQALLGTIEKEKLDEVLAVFVEKFPTVEVYRKKKSLREYLSEESGGRSNRLVTLEELILLYFANSNPAFSPFKELFDDAELASGTMYPEVVALLEKFFKNEKPFGPDHQSLFELLRAPILAHPDSLEAQLQFIRRKWGMVLSAKYLDLILSGMDFLAEELKIGQLPGAVMPPVPTFKHDEGGARYDLPEYERFTSDTDWMPRVVLLAKNSYVWLDQLSKKYRRPVTRLDQIPDEELDQLARWNFTALWLIGLWERSPASQRIKQLTGNPEAVPSAYSLFDYEIANDLGGEEAFQNLKGRAWRRGIRLAGDMVPNHMGMYSRWVVEHPDFFIQSEYSPFPSYRFTGENLSHDPRVELRIEDGYWHRSDAAVVFQRIDRATGKVAYIYHGNDGTSMPWNDTAQLDILKAEVREALIQTIFHVARKFPIIRFDAAMTLTKKHYQRLWYPQPGTGGDIPSRAGHALSRGEFDKFFPCEFWRDVVDRINAEMPDTLLLAEAFWLMEGYFVRTLGMHRVYNSAFMHMLMKEENEKYRRLIKNTLGYNPEILKRYVNFMSNPDEQTAIAQFGKDDKYFGVALMMVTLPGLPMFAHGQIEGLTEKYGMEYKRPYYSESVDEFLIRRHEQEIFPLMGKRYLFSQVENFELYDFADVRGGVNDDVFAYSNVAGSERALIVYHNKYEECRGWIRTASPKSSVQENGERAVRVKTLGEALRINSSPKIYYLFKDFKANLEYLRSSAELYERGLYIELKAFQYHIFLDFRELVDGSGDYEHLARRLKGRGVPRVHDELELLRLVPVHKHLERILKHDFVESLAKGFSSRSKKFVFDVTEIKQLEKLFQRAGSDICTFLGGQFETEKAVQTLEQNIQAIERFIQSNQGRHEHPRKAPKALFFHKALTPEESRLFFLVIFINILSEQMALKDSRQIVERLRLSSVFRKLIYGEPDKEGAGNQELLFSILLHYRPEFSRKKISSWRSVIEQLFNDSFVRDFLNVNLYEGVWYFNKEQFERLIGWFALLTLIQFSGEEEAERFTSVRHSLFSEIQAVEKLAAASKYRVEQLQELLMKSFVN
ncbi:MAG: alpha-amylase [Bacteroidota bacterium]|nr:alpha-amylase [Bacteroidota bacterium]